jgi:uncharacterized membrane protein
MPVVAVMGWIGSSFYFNAAWSNAMPPGDVTEMTPAECATIAA